MITRTPEEQPEHCPAATLLSFFVKMVIVDNTTGEPDVARLFTLLSDLMEQTNNHRNFTAQLHAQTGGIKTQAIHSQTGHVLRRFNMDMKKGGTFGGMHHDVQCQELTRIREYESRILERDTEAQAAQLAVQTAVTESLTRLSALLRSALREFNGEGDEGDPDAADWALERENAVLRTLLGVPGGEEEVSLRLSSPPQDEGRRSVQLAVREGSGIKGGPKGTVGPFRTYKKLHFS
ncbi:hypothetical protein BJV78DRAFT_1352593 [Lactifluus subvellereus]|nr:hypothetical protein BJV78DRAFT_1352593 [Lactifluus subvellereus]